jgi:pimeloyl-ACP methyl ester carboxylesterase
MARVEIIPGLAVRQYVLPAARALASRGIDVHLLAAPASPAAASDLSDYGQRLAQQIEREGLTVDLLMGLSVGAQAAAVTATKTERVRHLALVSPTVDPRARTPLRLLGRFASGGRREPLRLGFEQAPDWFRAGPRRLISVTRSALQVRIEDVLAGRETEADLTVIHAERDAITSHAYAAALAADHHGRLVVVPDATHSWPYADQTRFADLVMGLLA